MAVKFEARLPGSVPRSVSVYKLQRPTINEAALLKSARGLGLGGRGKDFIASADSLAYQEGRYLVEVQRLSGAIQFRHVDRYGREPENAFDVSDRRAATIARRFLETARLFPIQSARQRRITHMHGASADLDTKKVTERVIDAGVVFGRYVDDLPVDGPGGFAMVNIDAEAEVVGMRAIWRPLGKRHARVRVKSPEDAVREMEKLASKFKGDTTVTKAGFGYFEQGPLDAQTLLEPAFWFVYVVRYGEVAHKSALVVHAGDKSFAPLIGKKRFPSYAQKARRKR